MFVLTIELESGELYDLVLDSFDSMWEIKEYFEGEGFDVDWEYEPTA